MSPTRSDASKRTSRSAPIVDRYRLGRISRTSVKPNSPSATGRILSIRDRDAGRRRNSHSGFRGYGRRSNNYCEIPSYRYNRYGYGYCSPGWSWSSYYWWSPRYCSWRPGYLSFYWSDCWSSWSWPWIDTWCYRHPSSYYLSPGPYSCEIASYAAWSIPYTYVAATPVVDEEPIVDVSDYPVPDRSSEATLATYYIELADLYFKTRRYARAAAAYARAVKLVPADGSLRLVLADAWIAVGDYEQAAYSIRQGYELDPDLASIEIDKRLAYGSMEDFDKHVDAMRRRIGEVESDINARLCLACTLRFGDDMDEANVQLERILAIDPEDKTAKLLAAR
ncbi:MAG: hypothetical protein KDC95_10905 [Planctomycetes bacterium]|nr:hypothetical protein [Planctomycetota bacterium]